MNPRETENFTSLTYLGLRSVFGAERSDSSLRALASTAISREVQRYDLTKHPAGHKLVVESREILEKAVELGQGVILCLPHMGLFNFVPAHLAMSGIPVTMVVDGRNFEQEVANYQEWARLYEGSHPDPMRYVNAESPQSAWLMLRDLREGRVVFFGYDANGGLDGQNLARTTVSVDFAGLRINVRKGAAFIGAKANALLLPGIVFSDAAGRSTLKLFRPILRKPTEAIEEFCQRSMQTLYSLLEDEVRKDPACWEQWRHLHSWLVPDPDLPNLLTLTPERLLTSQLKTDRSRIAQIKIDGVETLAHERTGTAFVESGLVRSILGFFDEAHPVEELLANPMEGELESDVLAALVTLIGSGFVRITEQGAA